VNTIHDKPAKSLKDGDLSKLKTATNLFGIIGVANETFSVADLRRDDSIVALLLLQDTDGVLGLYD
jgi:hypothetical protein